MDNEILSSIIIKFQVLYLSKQGIIDTSFIGLDSTSIAANTSQNNLKSFLNNKFMPDNQPKANADCKLGVHTTSYQINEKKYEFYWDYKNYVLVDCISGLPLYELITTVNTTYSSVALDILFDTHSFLSIKEYTFLADKGYDVKNIYNQVHLLYDGECIIPLYARNTKNTKLLLAGVSVCATGLAMNRDEKYYDRKRIKQKFCCPYKLSGTCPIEYPKFFYEKKKHGCTKYITIPNDLRLSIDRNRRYFKNDHSLRTECERYNSRFKNTGQERMWIRNKSSVKNLNTLAHISLLAVAVAAITSHIGQSYRKLKSIKRTA